MSRLHLSRPAARRSELHGSPLGRAQAFYSEMDLICTSDAMVLPTMSEDRHHADQRGTVSFTDLIPDFAGFD